ncbi:MAG TPA: TonB-dependent receptor [Gemmatimonadaceae bacterium]|nr:TonB-dependent receptor [Gemmatimonadaceae bacterium]
MSGSTSGRLRLLIACVAAMAGASGTLGAQQTTVHGKVVSDAGAPVASALVSVRGGKGGLPTDSAGDFTITVPDANATLVVSRIGFEQREVPLNGQTSIVVRLKPTAVTLDATVVVGYGTQKRSDVTGSVASVNPEQLRDKPNSNFAQSLEGAVPGVNVTTSSSSAEGNDLNIVIRGKNSIKASNKPLIVVDGIPYDGSISEINQSDIESIQVLKDASAAAIYGSRGSNGVILITTKMGASGKPRISYDAYAGVQKISHMPHLMTGPEFAQFKCDRLNGGVDCASALTQSELDVLNAGTWTDWVGLATRTGNQQQHNLSISGGTDGTKYYIAGSLLDVNGIAKGDEFKRYSMRVNLRQKYKEWLELGTNTQLSQADRGGMPASFSDAFYMNPLTNPYNPDGTLAVRPWPEDPVWANPLEGLVVTDADKSRRVFTSNYIQAKLPYIDGLSYRLNAGIDYSNRDQGRYFGRNTDEGLTANGSAYTDNTNRLAWTLENILRYTHNFGKHGIDITTLYSAQRDHEEAVALHGEGFPNDVLTYHQMRVANLLEPADSVTETSMISMMGRLNYNYDDRYLLTLTARRDGSSVFGADHKYGTFPSVAVAWNASNESFWPGGKKFNTLKLRASYGRNGNQAIRPYQTLSQLDEESYINSLGTLPGYIPATLGTPGLKWETTTQLNVGADFGLLNNRLQGSADFYLANTKDLLLDRAISPVQGIPSITQNIGKTRNKGFELQLTSLNIDHQDFSWSTTLNFALNRNKIVDLYGNGQNDIINQWFIGHPIDVGYGYKFDGIWQEGDDIANSAQPTAKPGDVRIVDVNKDGKIDEQDRTFLGDLEPDYTAGLQNTLRYKRFTLSAFLNTVQGITRANELLSTNQVFTEVRRNTILATYWTPDNPINTYPRNDEDANTLSVPFYQDASYIRLQDVTLSYQVPESFAARMGMQSLRVYFSGRNLWTHTKWTGLDPELDSQRARPLAKIFTGGINVEF